jgi:2-deoxy-D-gluconate 3-dehydrogenase
MVNFSSLNGKKAIVTGSARGLCNGIATAYHEAGAEVVLVDVNENVKDAAQKMSTGDIPVHYIVGDLTDTAHLPAI